MNTELKELIQQLPPEQQYQLGLWCARQCETPKSKELNDITENYLKGIRTWKDVGNAYFLIEKGNPSHAFGASVFAYYKDPINAVLSAAGSLKTTPIELVKTYLTLTQPTSQR